VVYFFRSRAICLSLLSFDALDLWKAAELCSLPEVKLMVHEMIDGTYRQTNLPNESPEYLAKREEVRLAEIELLNTRERVAALRRELPKGATIQDYEFIEGPTSLDDGDAPKKTVRLS
jgi:hypothetical protein